MEITVSDLVLLYLSYWTGGRQENISSVEVRRIFSAIEKSLVQSQKNQWGFWLALDREWLLDQETLVQGKRLLSKLIDHLAQSETFRQVVALFFKLLALDQTVLSLMPALLATVSNLRESKQEMLPWELEQFIIEIPFANWALLAEFINHTDEKVQRGALAFWKAIIAASLEDRYFHRIEPSKWHQFKSLRFDWQIGLYLIDYINTQKREQGIALLTFSDFPITEETRRTKLLNAMAEAQEEENTAWARLLRHIPIVESNKPAWQKLLETVLSQPRNYSLAILTAAMKRYTELAGRAAPHIAGDETALGLPTLKR